ncbi:MAG: diguanylate cyclase [Planctomycetes bacterium]|nr:diguanylate cyclase [Planctomycetota bacterium]
MRILLIEDDRDDVDLLLENLRRSGLRRARVTEVASLSAALAAFAATDFDLVLLALSLVDTHGTDGVSKLLEVNPELPIVVLTNDPSHAGEALRLGAQDYLVKQELTPPLLERSLRYARERKRHENEIITLKRELEQLSERLADLAMTDPLTGLGNRRAFEDTLDAELRRARRQAAAVGLLLVDVDVFKAINDRYGHELGDQVLVAAARSFEAAARRAGERAFRIGGDEFALVVACEGGGDLADVAARIHEIFHQRRPLPAVTLSLGSAIVSGTGAADRRLLIRCADRALYAAKEAGGDRHVGYREADCLALEGDLGKV